MSSGHAHRIARQAADPDFLFRLNDFLQAFEEPWIEPCDLVDPLDREPLAQRFGRDQQPVGETLRPGSTPMWAGLRFDNGYSPILAAGVAREFATSIHGEINPDVGDNLLNRQAGPEGELALLGVDGIVVAREVNLAPHGR